MVPGVFVVLLSTPLGLAQVVQQPTVPLLVGQVVDQEGRPVVADVRVTQVNGNLRSWSYRSDMNGWFEVSGWADTPAEIRVTAEGYTSERVEVTAPATWPPLVVRLRRSASIIGLVRDRVGLPVSDVRIVVLEQPIMYRSVATHSSEAFVLSDPAGQYSIAVPAGRPFRLRFERDGCRTVDTEHTTLSEAQRVAVDAVTIDCAY